MCIGIFAQTIQCTFVYGLRLFHSATNRETDIHIFLFFVSNSDTHTHTHKRILFSSNKDVTQRMRYKKYYSSVRYRTYQLRQVILRSTRKWDSVHDTRQTYALDSNKVVAEHKVYCVGSSADEQCVCNNIFLVCTV